MSIRPITMNQHSSSTETAALNEVAFSPLEPVAMARQLLLNQENVPATYIASISSFIAVKNRQEQPTQEPTRTTTNNHSDGIDADIGSKTPTESTWTSGIQINPPPRPTRKSSSDRHQMSHACATVHGRAMHHLAWARDFFSDEDGDDNDDCYDDDESQGDSHDCDATASSSYALSSSADKAENTNKSFEKLFSARLELRSPLYSASPDVSATHRGLKYI